MMFNHLIIKYLLRGQHAKSGSIILNQQRIYILPSRSGLVLVVVLLAMLLGAINYHNSLAYALIFLIFSVAAVSMLHTWRNLYGLHFRIGDCQPVHVGEMI